MRLAALLMTGMLAACSNEPKQNAAPPADPPNHWTMTPSGNSTVDGITYPTAWRLDQQTGQVSFCYYDNGPEKPLVSRDGRVLSQGPNVTCVDSDPPR